MDDLNDKKYIEENLHEAIKSAEEAVNFFDNKQKSERERYVCEVFLRSLKIEYNDQDIIQLEKGDQPPDIIFKDARFEVMEIMDENRRRHDEYKKRLKKLKTNPTIDDFSRSYGPEENEDVTFSELVPLITSKLKANKIDKKQYAPEVRAALDILVYINLRDRFLDVTSHIPDCLELRSQGWRSVSMLFNGSHSCIFYAEPDAPEFIKQNARRTRSC